MRSTKLICALILTSVYGCSPKSDFHNTNFDILIANGKIVDGSGGQPYLADVLVRADTIAYMGKVDTTQITYKSLIDATGKVVSPGFIDVHAHGNPLSDTPMDNFLKMGVTTIVLGQDGSHPTRDSNDGKVGLIDWMGLLEEKGSATNVAMLAGHATLRREAGIDYADDPTAAQLQEMKENLESALKAGCFGLSTGLEYVGGMSAKEEELETLAKVVGGKSAIMMSHVRNEDDDQVEQSIEELLSLGEHCKVHVSHMKVVYGRGSERADELLSKLASARADGIEVSADVYPYLASYTTIGIVFPEWAKTIEQFEVAKRTRNKELREYLFNRVQKRNGPEATLLAGNQYAGKTLAQAATELGLSFVDLILQIGPNGGSGAYFIMEDSLMSTLLLYPETM
ncbi:MAG: N-acyl-D-amino acid deacylase, partial [Cyclobacteriaceae bacterium]